MAVTYEHTQDGRFRISREFRSLSAAAAGARALESVADPAYEPTPPPNCDGHHAVEAPMPPHIAEVIARHEDDDTPEAGLNFDKPLNPVSQRDEE